MSRPARSPVALFGSSLACLLALGAPLAGAQTIADYSRSQRLMLESAMAQATARSAGLGASAPAAAASTALAVPPPASRMPLPPPAPAVQVRGVFASREGVVAEVTVNATAYLLRMGQSVPGTAWHVETIDIDRVVLAREAAAAVGDAQGVRKVFALPALR